MKKVLAVLILLACMIGLDVMVGRQTLSGEPAAAVDFKQEMMIGLLLPLGGEQSDRGRSAKRGFDLAATGLRAWGTATTQADSRCNPQYALNALDDLIAAGSEVIVGAVCPAVADRAEELLAAQGIALVSLSAGQPRTDWRADAHIENEEAMADYFVAAHNKKFGSEPNHWAALAFDTLTAVAMELRDNQGDGQELLDHFRVMDHHGVSGVVKFRVK